MNYKIRTDKLLGTGNGSFWDMTVYLKQGWAWLVAGMTTGFTAALLSLALTPVYYESTVVLTPAAVGKEVVEPVVQTLERLKLPTFYDKELLEVCRASVGVVLSNMKASQVKGASLVQVSFQSPSPDVSAACLNATVAHLAKTQMLLSEPMLLTMREGLELTQRQLKEAEAFQSQLEKRATSSADATSLLMLNSLSKREEIVRLQKMLVDQKLLLSPPFTVSMQLLEPVYTPEHPQERKSTPILAGGLLGGFVLGLLGFFVRRSFLERFT